MTITYMDLAESLVVRLEALRLTAYPDSGGNPTIGYGHTGSEVRLGMSISEETAKAYLAVDLGAANKRLSEVCDAAALNGLHAHQHAALISFVFNLGALPHWEIWHDIDTGNLADVPTQMMRFDKGEVNGALVVIDGLEHRRQAEIIYWNTGDEDVAVSVTQTANAIPSPSSSFTRALSTPPTPVPAPPGTQTSLIAKAVAALGGVGATAAQLHAVVAPHVSESPIFQHAAVVLTGLTVIAASAGVLIHVNQSDARAA